MSDQPHESMVLVHDETGDEYQFTDRATYLATFYGGGYSEKSEAEPSRTPAPAAPRPVTPQPAPRPAGDS